MKRNEYEKPAMQVVELQQQAQLLAGSAGAQDYPWHTEPEESRPSEFDDLM